MDPKTNHRLNICIDTLEPDANGSKDTVANRAGATELLLQFETTITTLTKRSQYCVYNLGYSTKCTVTDTLKGYRALSSQRGDSLAAEQAQAAFDQILLLKGTWEPVR